MTLPAPPLLPVMSWNIRRRIPPLRPSSPDAWRRRAPLVRRLLQQQRPAVLGAQEALPDQADAVLDALGDGYRRLGRGRSAGGTGEGCPLFYDAERLELLRWRQLALSDTPGRAGSRGFGNLVPRIAVAARLRDRASGAAMLVVNTHLDPFSPRSRVRSARMLHRLVADAGIPALVLGDFNARIDSPAHRLLADGVVLRDVFAEHAPEATAVGTFGGYRAPRAGGARIDWILASPSVAAPEVATLAEPVDGAWPSDHLPVCASVRIPATEAA
jgi:endonuclease/exonuclease/phosphatase family metal-dependent hydrolase